MDAAAATETRLRQVIREAHETQQGLRDLLREIRAAVAELPATVDELIGGQVNDGLEQYKATLGQAIDSATEGVFRRFDTIVAALLGEDSSTPLEDALRRFRDRQQLLEARALAALANPGEE